MSDTSSQTTSYTAETWRIFASHMRRYRWWFFLTFFGVVGGTLTDMLLPFFYKRLFDGLADPARNNIATLVVILVWILAMHCIARLGFFLAQFTESYGVAKVMSDLLDTCFKYLHGHSHGFFNNSFTGSLVRKATRYTRSFEDINDQIIWSIVPAFITLISSIFILGYRNIWLGIGVFLWSVAFIGVNYRFVLYKMRFDARRVEADTAVSGHLADTLTNHLNLKLFGGIEKEYSFFASLTDAWFRKQRKVWQLNAYSFSVQSLFMYALEFGVLYYALHMWRQGAFTVGDFVFLQGIVLQIGHQLWGVGRYLHAIYEGFANAGEMTEILLKGHDIVDVPGAKPLMAPAGVIDFDAVGFGYEEGESAIFNNFNLHIPSGHRVALVGSSGSGKSTLIKLLFRFADIQGGAIKIDGQNIAEVTQHSLRDALSLVPQESSLFHRSILENIRYARPEASVEEVMAAAKAAHCHEFIQRFPEGYETMVGERGVKLSGGERQRVAIARAILKDAPILVLDEATSSLDSESEQLIQDALSNLMKDRTTIVIAHRLSTIMQMHTIYVLDQGQVVEHGSHNELRLRENGFYRKLWDIQAGGFM